MSWASVPTKAGERGAGGGKYLGPGLIRGPRNLGKTSGHGGWGLVMCNHLLVLGPDCGSRQPWFQPI